MHRCLQLANLSSGNVAPNPMVGAVLVYNNTIIGEGYHKKFGEAHAEVNCINSVVAEHKTLIDKSTLYVSLEPCSHFGKTPPCTDLIIKKKIPNVIIGCKDINPKVSGINKLLEAGINVTTGVLEKECIEINKRFFTFHREKRPYIILKWAESENGKIQSAEREQRTLISNEFTNRLVHKWRSEEASILIGTNTALNDDPSLTTRLWPGNDPVRLVIDLTLRLPGHLKIFNKEVKTIIFNNHKNAGDGNNIFYKISENPLTGITGALHEQQILSMIVEGGATLLQSFIEAGLWDEARIIRNERLKIKKGIAAPELKNAILKNHQNYFNDSISYFLPFS